MFGWDLHRLAISWCKTDEKDFEHRSENKMNWQNSRASWFWTLELTMALMLAACGSFITEDDPSLTVTLDISPSSTYTATPNPTWTNTLEPSLTPTLTPTPTAVPIFLTLKETAGCRSGPGVEYRIIDYLDKGSEFQVVGLSQREDEFGLQIWYVVIGPVVEENCWVFETLVELSSDTGTIAILAGPPTNTPAPVPTLNPNGVVYYLIHLGTGGPFGCGDSLVAINSGIKRTGDIEQDIINALNALFNLKTEYSGAFYNAMYQSSLKAKSVEMDGRIATVYTRGTVVKPPDDCDKERFRLQVFTTVKDFGEVDRAIIYANNALLGDLLEQGNK